jgi:hypothetical protein
MGGMKAYFIEAAPGRLCELILADKDAPPLAGRGRPVFGPYRSRGHVEPVEMERLGRHQVTTPRR